MKNLIFIFIIFLISCSKGITKDNTTTSSETPSTDTSVITDACDDNAYPNVKSEGKEVYVDNIAEIGDDIIITDTKRKSIRKPQPENNYNFGKLVYDIPKRQKIKISKSLIKWKLMLLIQPQIHF